jgi:hypothetical protein
MTKPRLIDVVKRLHALGHAPEYPVLTEGFFSWCFSSADSIASELVRRYQAFHGLPPNGRWGCPVLHAHLARPRCGHPDVLPVAGLSSWSIRSLAYYQTIAFPGVPASEVALEYAEAVRRIAAACGLSIAPASVPAAAQVVAASGPIDGQWNVLALSELPPADAPLGTVLHQTFDSAEGGLTKDQRIAMMAHEFCHCLGLGHAQPGSGNLMEPVLSSIGAPQPGWDIPQLQQRYGPPKVSTPAPAPAPKPAPAPAQTFVVHASPGHTRYLIDTEIPGTFLITVAPQG